MTMLPKRWLPYKALGETLAGTRFIAFKVPLKETLCSNLEDRDRFTVKHLMERVKRLGLVVDLTNTNRYYSPEELRKHNVQYAKIYTEGHRVPDSKIVLEFCRIVDDFVRRNPDNGKLIGVHCTHGLNRTGYLICRYMIDKLGFAPNTAIAEFNRSRGHKIERENYIADLIGEPYVEPRVAPTRHWRNTLNDNGNYFPSRHQSEHRNIEGNWRHRSRDHYTGERVDWSNDKFDHSDNRNCRIRLEPRRADRRARDHEPIQNNQYSSWSRPDLYLQQYHIPQVVRGDEHHQPHVPTATEFMPPAPSCPNASARRRDFSSRYHWRKPY